MPEIKKRSVFGALFGRPHSDAKNHKRAAAVGRTNNDARTTVAAAAPGIVSSPRYEKTGNELIFEFAKTTHYHRDDESV